MGFLRTAVTLVAAGIATNMVLKARRDGMATRAGSDDGSSGSTSSGSGGGAGLSSVSGVVGGGGSSGSAGMGASSPNAGERMAGQGMASSAVGGDSDNGFGSSSQQGSTPRTPGLSDYSRGA